MNLTSRSNFRGPEFSTAPRRRYRVAVILNSLIAGTFVALASRSRGARQPLVTRANLLTFSRAGAAAVVSGTAASPELGRRTVWLALLWGGPSDWLDGPLARRDGATKLGALLDVEADSWLILWAAMAAWRIGELPWWSVAPPVLRYVIPAVQARGRHHRPLDRPWQRVAAGLQTSSLTLALAPARRLNQVGRAIAPMAAIAQMAAIAWSLRELRRQSRAEPDTGAPEVYARAGCRVCSWMKVSIWRQASADAS